jgi:prophage antirepressor-like protein
MPDSAYPRTPDSAIQPFVFPDTAQQVRVVLIDGEPWFVAADVCSILGHRKAADLVRRMDADEYRVLQPWEFAQFTLGAAHDPRLSGQLVTLFSEAGLYSAILWSSKAEAKAFRRWLTHDVLPSIRRTGAYGQLRPLSRRELAENWADAERRAELAEARRAELEAVTEEMAPKVDAFDAFMEADGTYSMGAVANMLGIGRNTLFRRLREDGVLQRDNRPYQRHAAHFKVIGGSHDQNGREMAHYTTYVHPSGVDFIRQRLFPPGSQLTLVS